MCVLGVRVKFALLGASVVSWVYLCGVAASCVVAVCLSLMCLCVGSALFVAEYQCV